MYLNALAQASKNANMESTGDNVRYSPIMKNSKGKYVQADRQVITSADPNDWETDIYNYINDKIRNGQDVVIHTDDGDNLTITEKTAWKMGYWNEYDTPDGKQSISKGLYRTKINAATHIDEIAEISKRGKKNVPDTKNHDFAQDGFNYRTAYFRDFDGKYYRLKISVGLNQQRKTVYNIGIIDEIPFPDITAQRQRSNDAPSAKRNSKDRIPQSQTKNNPQNQKDTSRRQVANENDTFRANQIYSENFKNWFGDWENNPENASKVVNEDGTPKVVYHGTDAEFTVFDRTKGRSGMDIQGMFFSPWEIDAGGYGKNIGAYYLDIKNPASEAVAYKALNRFKGQNYAGVKAREYLESLGYDGVNNNDEEYIAFYPTQIKSATDNIGTFDKNNPDIRYQFVNENDSFNAHKLAVNIRKGTDIGEDMTFNELKGKLQSLYDNFYTANQQAMETQNFDGIQKAYDDIVDFSGELARKYIIDRIEDENIKEIRRMVRGTVINVAQYANDLTPDRWKDYQDSVRGYYTPSKSNGVPMDSLYMELSSQYPSYFPETPQNEKNNQAALKRKHHAKR